MATSYTPTSVYRMTRGVGFYGAKTTLKGVCQTAAGRWLVGNSASGTYYLRPNQVANTEQYMFEVDQDTTSTTLYKRYYVTVIPNATANFTGTPGYKTVDVPRFAFMAYVNSSNKIEINSLDYSTPAPSSSVSNFPSGYSFYGWTSTKTVVTVGCHAGTTWNNTSVGGKWLDGEVWYAVFKKPGSTTSATLKIQSTTKTASKTTTDAFIGGVGTTKSGGNTSYTNESDPTFGSYDFQGWATSSTSTSTTYSTAKQALDAGYTGTLYAVFYKSFPSSSVTLNANGGSCSYTSASKSTTPIYLYGTSGMSGGNVHYYPSDPEPTRSGYSFQGWSTSSSATYVSYSSTSAALDAGYTGTLYAVWDEETYTAYFSANGGSGSVSSRSATYNSAFTFPSGSNLYLDGYEFQGWSINSSGSGIIYGAGERWVWQWTDDMVFYAVWEESTKGVSIFTSSTSSSLYAVYISNGSSWSFYAPYVYDGGWKEIG